MASHETMPAACVDVLWERTDAPDEPLLELLEARSVGLLVAAGVPDRELSVVFMDDAQIRELNRTWRQEDKATDVLSFPMDEGEILAGPGDQRPLGDIVISLDTAAAQAREHDWSLLEEVTFLLVHGLCHLLGHDHAEPEEAAAMREAEDRLLDAVAPGHGRPPTPY